MITERPSGKRTTTSGRRLFPSSSFMFPCIKYSWSRRSPLPSSIDSRIISPQSPCTLESPLSAFDRLAASWPMRCDCSPRFFTTASCCCHSSFRAASKLFCSSFLFTSFCVRWSSIDFLNSANCSRTGCSSCSIWFLLADCSACCLSASRFPAEAFISCLSVSNFSAHWADASLRRRSAWARSETICSLRASMRALYVSSLPARACSNIFCSAFACASARFNLFSAALARICSFPTLSVRVFICFLSTA